MRRRQWRGSRALGRAPMRPKAAAEKWVDSEFQPCTLSKEQQLAELKWFIKAAEALCAGPDRSTSSPRPSTTHEYESKTLTKAFEEITGIKVKHDLIQEGDVIEKLQTQCSRARSSTTPVSTTPT